MQNARRATDWLMLFGLVAFWGSSFALTAIAVASIPPVWVMALRLVIGALLLHLLRLRAGERLPRDAAALGSFLQLGLVGSVLPFTLISWAAGHIASGLIGIAMALVPLFTLALAWPLLPNERPRPAEAIGFLIGFAGLLMLIGPDVVAGFSLDTTPLLAELAVMLATLAYALQLILARRAPDMPFLVRSTGVLSAAAICGLALALLTDPAGLVAATPAALMAIGALGLFPTALASLLLFGLLERSGAAFVSLSNYLLSPWAYCLGVLALGEPLEARSLAGLAVILAGIYIAERRA